MNNDANKKSYKQKKWYGHAEKLQRRGKCWKWPKLKTISLIVCLFTLNLLFPRLFLFYACSFHLGNRKATALCSVFISSGVRPQDKGITRNVTANKHGFIWITFAKNFDLTLQLLLCTKHHRSETYSFFT